MKALVTGAAGFIGGYITKDLLKEGYEVIGLDNFSKYGNFEDSKLHVPGLRMVEGDARDTDLLTDLMEDVDHVIAGAAMIGGISYFHTYAYDLLAANERIIAATCDAAIKTLEKKNRLKKVTYLSSSMVFESTKTWPSREGDERTSPPPLSSYGFQKLSVEYFAHAAWDQYRLPFTILRPFNCVGVGERRALSNQEISSGEIKLALSHVVPDIIQKIVKGQYPVKVLGDGSQVRHYTYGEDLARGISLSLNNPAALNEDFNLSTDESTTVRELVEIIWNKINPDQVLEIEYETPFTFDVAKRIPDTSKAKSLLGFSAETSLSEMLDIVIPWVQSAVRQGLI
jgi:nucleoside-diphosphate-sugar epimerase